MTPRLVVGALSAVVALAVLAGVWAGGSGGPAPVSVTGRGRTYLATAELAAAVTGVVDVAIGVRRPDGTAADDAHTVVVSSAMTAMGHVTPELAARRDGPGRFHVRGELFPMPGTWVLDIRIDGTSGTDVIGVEVPVEQGGR